MKPIEVPVRVRGRTRWMVFDERGERVPVMARYADGRERLLWGGHWNSNLITDQGLDAFAETAWGWVGLAAENPGSVRHYGRVGTGSTAPAFTDTTLVNQVDCSGTASPFDDNGFSASEDGTEITLECLRRVAFTMEQARNLTEYGFGATPGGEWQEQQGVSDEDACAGVGGSWGVLDTSSCMGSIVAGPNPKCWVWNDFNDIYVRELFRDSGGTPITIPVPAGRSLRIDHTYDITLDLSMQTGSFDVESYDVSDNLVGTDTIDYDARWWSRQTSSGTATENGRHLAQALRVMPGNLHFSTSTVLLYSTTPNPDISTGTRLGFTPSGYSWAGTTQWPAGATLANREYTPGSHERIYDITISAAQGNFDWTGWGYRRNSTYDDQNNQGGGFIVAFRNSHAFTKADTHTLRWSIKWSWARA